MIFPDFCFIIASQPPAPQKTPRVDIHPPSHSPGHFLPVHRGIDPCIIHHDVQRPNAGAVMLTSSATPAPGDIGSWRQGLAP